jgi:defect in organelle trafficking protein DotC
MEAVSLEQLEKSYESRQYTQKNKEVPQVLGAMQNARNQAVYDAAFSLGLKGGMASQLEKINSVVEQKTSFLEKTYNFTPYLLSQGRVIPPVITEARDLYNQDGDYAVRLSGALYKIERQARLASVAPNWREYLNFPAGVNVKNISSSISPNNSEEKLLWQKAIRSGWADGIEQANILVKQAFDRLNRDFIGILRFHRFVEEGKVTLPVLAASKMDFNKSTSSLAVDEQLLRLTVLPDFATTEGWKAKIISHVQKTNNYGVVQNKTTPKLNIDTKKLIPSVMNTNEH